MSDELVDDIGINRFARRFRIFASNNQRGVRPRIRPQEIKLLICTFKFDTIYFAQGALRSGMFIHSSPNSI